MSIDVTLRVSEIQRFCMHDGEGVRTTVFLKGCPLCCAWCHNPETQSAKTQLLFYEKKCISCAACVAACAQGVHTLTDVRAMARSRCVLCGACVDACPTGALAFVGTETSVADILAVVEKDRAFYGEKGGVTLSGGEPLAQKNILALLQACKERGLHTAVETCGYVDRQVLRAVAPYVDVFLWDVKDTDGERHQRFTGADNQKIIDNLRLIDGLGRKTQLRCILVNGVNTDELHYERVAELASTLRYTEGVKILPYHAYGGAKCTFLGGTDNGNTAWIPTAEQIGRMKTVLTQKGVKVL